MRRGEESLHEDHDENVLEDHNPKPVHPGATALPESAESSVEGKLNFLKSREIVPIYIHAVLFISNKSNWQLVSVDDRCL